MPRKRFETKVLEYLQGKAREINKIGNATEKDWKKDLIAEILYEFMELLEDHRGDNK